MILFRPEHVAPILEGRKTQTRRLGSKRWNIGAIHQCTTNRVKPESTFARVRILDVRQELLAGISEAAVRAEGYSDREEFFAVFCDINPGMPEELDEDVWVVEFEVVE